MTDEPMYDVCVTYCGYYIIYVHVSANTILT